MLHPPLEMSTFSFSSTMIAILFMLSQSRIVQLAKSSAPMLKLLTYSSPEDCTPSSKSLIMKRPRFSSSTSTRRTLSTSLLLHMSIAGTLLSVPSVHTRTISSLAFAAPTRHTHRNCGTNSFRKASLLSIFYVGLVSTRNYLPTLKSLVSLISTKHLSRHLELEYWYMKNHLFAAHGILAPSMHGTLDLL